jgi:hypothetical protein
MVIQKIRRLLGDGSPVFDVKLWDDASSAITLHAVTERDADEFVRILTVAVENHTNNTVEFDDAA